MHDLHCKYAKDMHSEILAKRVYELKETPKGVENMCREMEELMNEGIKIGEIRGEKRGEKRGEIRGRAEGELKKAKETAKELYKIGMEVEKIAEILKVSPDDIKKWIAETE